MSSRPSRKRSRKGGQQKNNVHEDEALSSFWACPFCTLKNPLRRRRCGVCESRRPVVAPEQHEEEATTTTINTTVVSREFISTNASPSTAKNNDTTTCEEPQPPPKKRSKKAVATWLQKRRRRASKSPEKTGTDDNSNSNDPCYTQLIKVCIKFSDSVDFSDCENLVGHADDLDNLLEASIPSGLVSRFVVAPILGTHGPDLDAQTIPSDSPPLSLSESQTALPGGDDVCDNKSRSNIVRIRLCLREDKPDSTAGKSSQSGAHLLQATVPRDFMHVQSSRVALSVQCTRPSHGRRIKGE